MSGGSSERKTDLCQMLSLQTSQSKPSQGQVRIVSAAHNGDGLLPLGVLIRQPAEWKASFCQPKT